MTNDNEYHIYGPPGTGKTTELVRNIQRASEKRGPDSVLVCSHTKAAATEVASRNISVNPDNVGTLHAICYRKFTRPEVAESHSTEWNALHPGWAIKGVSRNVDNLGATADTTTGSGLLQEISSLRNRMVPRENWKTSITGFAKAWEAWKRSNGYVDFTDMIEFNIGSSPPDGIEVAFIDEAQDFSALQFELVRQWLPSMDRAIFVGDDDQSIFGFSGADPENLISRDIPSKNRHILTQSYRVPKNIHRVADRFIQRCSRRLDKKYLPREGDDGEVVHSTDGDWRKPSAIADQIEHERRGREVDGQTTMILASCDYMLRPLLAELRMRGIAFHNPYRPANGSWNPLKSGEGSTVNRMLAFLKKTRRDPGWTWVDLNSWVGIINTSGVIKRGMKKIIEERAAQPGKHTELGSEGWEEVFEPDILSAVVQQNVGWLQARATPQRRKGMELPMQIYRRGGQELLKLKPEIIVGTIHSVKGGEADSVYLFPDLSLQGGEQWIRRGPRRDSVLRCFYVGMTRARHRLTILQPADGGIFVE